MILKDATVAEIKNRLAKYPSNKSAVLPALTAAFKQEGYLSPEMYREIAHIIQIPYVEVAEAASFYTMFPKEKVGHYYIQVCHNISCALRGADELITYLEEKLEIKLGDTTPDNIFTLTSVECLGGCCDAPMMQINDKYYENLTREEVAKLIDELRATAQQKTI